MKKTRAMRGANFSTDHRMILTKISLSVRPKTRMNGSTKKVNCGLLRSAQHREAYMEMVRTKLLNVGGADMEDLNFRWSQISDALQSAGLDDLGKLEHPERDTETGLMKTVKTYVL